MELFLDGFIYRWLHIWFGIIWIGVLYYFNFIQTPFMNEADTEAPAKSRVTRSLLPRALWWFRWAALGTFVTGAALFYIKYWDAMTQGAMLNSGGGLTIFVGVVLGTLMFLNVWGIIWRKQKVVMKNAHNVAAGQPADPNAATAAARAAVASRTNALFSIPMLFFMVSSAHYPYVGNKESSYFWPVFGLVFLVIAYFEWNAIYGKLIAPLKTVKSVVISGFVLWAFLYGATRFISTLG
jgi:uncharacterized membrane protein